MERLNNVSLLRLVAMLMIFVHHIRNGYLGDFYQASAWFPFYVGVGIFLFISGFLYANKSVAKGKGFYFKQFIKILVPYYVFMILLALVYLIVDPTVLTTTEILKATFILYNFFGGFCSVGHFWFIPFILICYLFIPLLQKLYDKQLTKKQTIWTKLLIWTLIIVECCASFFLNNRPTFICFFAGYHLGRKFLETKQVINSKRSIIVTSILFFASVTIYAVTAFGSGVLFDVWNNYFWHDFCGFVAENCTGLMAITFSLLFIKIFEFLNKKSEGYVLKWSDKYSYCFYITHQIFLIKALSTWTWTPYIWLDIILAFVCTIASAMVLEWIQKPIANALISLRKKPEIKETHS